MFCVTTALIFFALPKFRELEYQLLARKCFTRKTVIFIMVQYCSLFVYGFS